VSLPFSYQEQINPLYFLL